MHNTAQDKWHHNMTLPKITSLCLLYPIVTILVFLFPIKSVSTCGYPGSPGHASVAFTSETIEAGTIATYTCDNGYELLGPPRRTCTENGTWVPQGIPFCGKILDIIFKLLVAVKSVLRSVSCLISCSRASGWSGLWSSTVSLPHHSTPIERTFLLL